MGKINVAQMLAHCCGPLEVYFEEKKAKRDLMGLLFGKIAFKQLTGDKPWRRGLPTAKEFKIKEVRNFEEEKYNLVNNVNRLSTEGLQSLLLLILSLENYRRRNTLYLIIAISIIIFSNLEFSLADLEFEARYIIYLHPYTWLHYASLTCSFKSSNFFFSFSMVCS